MNESQVNEWEASVKPSKQIPIAFSLVQISELVDDKTLKANRAGTSPPTFSSTSWRACRRRS